MSKTAEELKDTLNDIERDVYDGVDFGGMFTEAYVLADELGESIDKLRDENAKLHELAARMARALGVGRGWCTRDCGAEFKCDWEHCPIEAALRELGIEVTA